jgi:CTP:molybdopterin cytidylyltransferase MocA
MILPKAGFEAAAAVRGDVGLRDLVAALPPEQIRLVALRSAELDVDTPADLTRARRRYARGWGTSR